MRTDKTKYLFFNKLTLELAGIPEIVTIDLDGGTVFLTDVAQTFIPQLGDLWNLVFTKLAYGQLRLKN